ncbi:MAG TPA: metal-dependent hydrolase [Thermoanaerobaculia bacterium]|nr:metal-dependent hydrolase [Thermoanaerobaculia bacterium]
MDPLTHALAGATLAWAATGRHLGRRALLIGGAAALLPDLDILIRSAADPLLAIEHHRGFTHSLLLIPIGGLLAALPFLPRTDPTQRRRTILAATLAYASHPLLDAATTYGTQLYWPFSRTRVGLDIISIIDPLFTALLLIATIAALTARKRLVPIALTLALTWLTIGYLQRERASALQTQLATQRRHPVHRGAVFPTVGNTIIWRSIYQTGNTLHLDRLRIPWRGTPTHAPIATLPLVPAGNDPHRDLHRFAWFSDHWLARDPADPTVIGDARYSLHTDHYEPVWGIRLDPGAHPPTEWVDRSRQRRAGMRQLWGEIRGEDAAYRPLRSGEG